MKTIEKVHEKIDNMFYDQVQFLSDLVRCRRVLCDPGEGEEKSSARSYTGDCKKMGARHLICLNLISAGSVNTPDSAQWNGDIKTGRRSQSVYKSKTGSGKSLALIGHSDVVPAGFE